MAADRISRGADDLLSALLRVGESDEVTEPRGGPRFGLQCFVHGATLESVVRLARHVCQALP